MLKASKAAVILHSVEQEPYYAYPAELDAVDEALAQVARGERASERDVDAAFARFRR